MKIVNPWIEVEKIDGIKIMKKLEKACRTCYRSEGSITEDSYKNLLKNCINRGHESVLEHEKVTIRMYCDIGVYKDLTRHRFGSFSIESTRYCSYDKDKYGNEIKCINPSYIKDTKIYEEWKKSMEEMEKHYMKMKEFSATTDMCRLILPHSAAAEVTMTADIREWKHILELRTSNKSHPAIRQLLIPLLKYFKKEMPEIFDGVDYDKDFDENDYAEFRISE